MFELARRISDPLRGLPQVGQIVTKQIVDYPTVEVDVDRTKAARLGITERSVITNLITAMNSNNMIKPSIWIDPRNGDDYYLSAQYFEENINSFQTLLNIPVGTGTGAAYHDYSYNAQRSRSDTTSGHEDSILLGDVARVQRTRYPSEADYYNIQRVVDVLVSPRTSDMGGTLDAVRRAVAGIQEALKGEFRKKDCRLNRAASVFTEIEFPFPPGEGLALDQSQGRFTTQAEACAAFRSAC
jgi:multidrug efflux pump subunit AcrB